MTKASRVCPAVFHTILKVPPLAEHLSIPDTQYDAQITMPSSEFLRIVRDIKELGESVKIEVTKEGIKFSAEGDIGTAAVTVRPTSSSTKKDSDDDSDEEEGSQSEDEDEPEKMDEDEKVSCVFFDSTFS